MLIQVLKPEESVKIDGEVTIKNITGRKIKLGYKGEGRVTALAQGASKIKARMIVGLPIGGEK